MLSSMIARSLRTPAVQAAPTRLRVASSTVWHRSMARNNRPNQNYNNTQKKPTDYSRPAGAPQPSRPGGASAAFSQPQPGAQNSDKAGRPDFSERQSEIDEGASPDRNTFSTSQDAGSKPSNPVAREDANPALSGEEAEFGSNSRSDDASAEFGSQRGPLPDLTRGIPSTLEYETTGSRASPLNLTEAGKPEPGAGGGRGKGELPASAYISSSEKKRARFANIMYAMVALLSVTGTVYLGRNWETEEEELQHKDAPSGWALGLMWSRAKARLKDQLSYYNEPAFRKLLPDPDPLFERPYTLVLSMEDLLIHSEWSREHGWRMAKRPGVDYFLRYLSQYYELVIFTSQPFALADPVIRKLDPYHIVTWPLFREATLYENGEYIKDLSYLNRDLSKVIIIDTKPSHTQKQPENAIILKPWKGDVRDKELVSFIPFLEYIHTMAYADVRKAIASFAGTHIPTEFARREAIARAKFQEQLKEEQKKRPKKSGLGLLGNALGIKSGGMMVMADGEQSPAEAFAQGKMLQDQARERGQKNYEALEREIRENGEKWLKEEQLQEEKAKEEGMKAMKSGFTGWFGGGPSKAQ